MSHTAFKTPTKVAEFLIERVALAERSVVACRQALGHLSLNRLRQAVQQLGRGEKLAQVARLRLLAAARAVGDAGHLLGRISHRRLREAKTSADRLTHRIMTGAPRLVERHRPRPRNLGRRLADIATGRLREVEAMLGGVARVCSELAPERTLERGYSITRDSADRIVREPRQVRPGDRIVTTPGRWNHQEPSGGEPPNGGSMSTDMSAGDQDSAAEPPSFSVAMQELESILGRIDGDDTRHRPIGERAAPGHRAPRAVPRQDPQGRGRSQPDRRAARRVEQPVGRRWPGHEPPPGISRSAGQPGSQAAAPGAGRLYVGCWTFDRALSSISPIIAQALARPRRDSLAPGDFSTFLDWYIWGLLFPLIWWVSQRFPFERGKLVSRIPIHLACGLIVSLIFVALMLIKEPCWSLAYGNEAAPRSPSPSGGLPGYLLGGIELFLLPYFAIVAFLHAVSYYNRYRERQLKTTRLEAQLALAHLEVLKMQLQPHFLFNTLNAISALMHRDVDAADRMISLLSDLLAILAREGRSASSFAAVRDRVPEPLPGDREDPFPRSAEG